MTRATANHEPYILIEGPRWADCKFYGEWLLAAADAEALRKQAFAESEFEKQVDRLSCASIPDFEITACQILMRFKEQLDTVAIQLDSEEGNQFCMMIEIGFARLTGRRYQMTIPSGLNLMKIKKAALKLAGTEDDECVLHPETFITTMPLSEVDVWQKRLRAMDDGARIADRDLLLEGSRPRADFLVP